MTQEHPITSPPPHLLKKFSAQAQDETKKRNGAGYLKTFATLCIEWAMNSQSTSNDRQIRSSEIEPPPELVHQWHKETCKDPCNGGTFFESKTLNHIATQAARWGGDQELEACLAEVSFFSSRALAGKIRDTRRPTPPSLREQALETLHSMQIEPCVINGVNINAGLMAKYDILRRALEQLND